jgi:hypothetical protein
MRISALVAVLAICSYASLSVQSYEESLIVIVWNAIVNFLFG